MPNTTEFKVKQIDSSTLRDLAYSNIKELILQGVIKPGGKIFQEKMASDLGISKIPLIQALALLEKEGILKKISQKGFFVRKVSKNEILEIFDVKTVFEEIGIKKLVQNLNEKNINKLKDYLSNFKKYAENNNSKEYIQEDFSFHHFLIESGNNEIIENFVDTLNVFIVVFLKGILDLNESYADHVEIINAILEKNMEKSVSGLKNHLGKVKNIVFKS